MKKIILLIYLFSCITYSQYEDTGTRGIYFSKKNYTHKEIPAFETSKDKLPSPILEDKPEWVKLYWKAWELAFDHFKQPPEGSPFVSNYLDEAFCFIKYARHAAGKEIKFTHRYIQP